MLQFCSKERQLLCSLPSGDRYVSAAGTAALATGGSGDVLTGIVATLLFQAQMTGTEHQQWLRHAAHLSMGAPPSSAAKSEEPRSTTYCARCRRRGTKAAAHCLDLEYWLSLPHFPMSPDDPFRRRRAIEMRTPNENKFSPHTSLGAGGEFDAIRRMLGAMGTPRAVESVMTRPSSLRSVSVALVVSTDTSVENVHFRRDWLSAEEIGYRCGSGCAERSCGNGRVQRECWWHSRFRSHGGASSMESRTESVRRQQPLPARRSSAVTRHGAPSSSLNFTVLGTAREVLFRTSARPGDRIYVTGRLGGPLAALRDLQAGTHTISGESAPVCASRTENRRRSLACRKTALRPQSIFPTASRQSSATSRQPAGSQLSFGWKTSRWSTECRPWKQQAAGKNTSSIVTSPSDIDTAGIQKTVRPGPHAHRRGCARCPPAVVMTQNGEPVALPAGYLHFTE